MCKGFGMKNVTITLDEQTVVWARVQAAEQGKSLSRFVGELIHQRMHDDRAYEEAMHRFLSRKPTPMNAEGAPYPSRDELHDRGRFR